MYEWHNTTCIARDHTIVLLHDRGRRRIFFIIFFLARIPMIEQNKGRRGGSMKVHTE